MPVELLSRLDVSSSQTHESSMGILRCPAGNLPLQRLAYRNEVNGCVVRSTIEQVFINSTDSVLEATYVFPIEGEQSVVGCTIQVQDRVIRAALQERTKARATYRQAIRDGHSAALLEEQRSETFSIRVGNIPAGESIRVVIETVGPLNVVAGEWTLRIPLVVAPRYTSGIPLSRKPVGDGIVFDTDQVPDASCVTPPVLLPGFPSPIQLELSVTITGDELKSEATWAESLECSLHTVLLEAPNNGPGCKMKILPGDRVDRDFILRGRFSQDIPTTCATIETIQFPECKSMMHSNASEAECSVFSLSVVGPANTCSASRDVIFLLDRSSSMEGWKYEAAKRATARLIESLHDCDRFQLATFDDSLKPCELDQDVHAHANQWIVATDENRFRASQWLAATHPRGGTELADAALWAVNQFSVSGHSDENRSATSSRTIVLITDGQIVGEDVVLASLGKLPVALRPRMLCIGVDRAVNGSVLRRVANVSGGTFELVESERRLTEVINRCCHELEGPALSRAEVSVDSSDGDWKLALRTSDCVYPGRLWQVFGACEGRHGVSLTLRALKSSGEIWEQKVTLAPPANSIDHSESLNLPMWGRFRVRGLEDELAVKNSSDAHDRELVVATSLFAGTLSRFTAYVAVDGKRIVHDRHRIKRVFQPNMVPEGWALEPVFGLNERDVEDIKSVGVFDRDWFEQSVLDNLIAGNSINLAQIDEAKDLAKKEGISVTDALETLQYVSGRILAASKSRVLGLPYIMLEHWPIHPETLQQVPESIARENECIPIFELDDALLIALRDPCNFDTKEKLRFILNRPILFVVECRDGIHAAINEYYGAIEGESADSMLQEFTDTVDPSDDDSSGGCFGFSPQSAIPSASAPARSLFGGDEEDDDDHLVAGFFPMSRNRSRPQSSTAACEELRASRLVDSVLRVFAQSISRAICIRQTHEGVAIWHFRNQSVEFQNVFYGTKGLDFFKALMAKVLNVSLNEGGVSEGTVSTKVGWRVDTLRFYSKGEGEAAKVIITRGLAEPWPEQLQIWWNSND